MKAALLLRYFFWTLFAAQISLSCSLTSEPSANADDADEKFINSLPIAESGTNMVIVADGDTSLLGPAYGAKATLLSPGGQLWIEGAIFISITDGKNIGKYQLQPSSETGKPSYLKYSPDSLRYESLSGWCKITKFDLDKHALSAIFVSHCIVTKDGQVIDTVTLLGRLDNADLMSESDLRSGKLIYGTVGGGYPAVYESRGGLFQLSDRTLKLSAFRHEDEYGSTGGSIHYSVDFFIQDPRVGFRPSSANNYWEDRMSKSAYKEEYSYSHTSRSVSTDSLVITKWDEDARKISGWFTFGSTKGEFIDLTWQVIR